MNQLLLFFFVAGLIYSEVEMEQLICWLPFLGLAEYSPLSGSHLYAALLLLATIQTLVYDPHPTIINSVVVLAAFQNVVRNPLAGNGSGLQGSHF